MKRPLFAAVLAALALSAGLVGCGQRPAPPPTVVPIPPAPPEPPTPPTPTVAGFVIVEDTAAAGQARGLFLTDKRVQAFLKGAGLKHAIVSAAAVGPDGQPPANVRKYLDAARGKPLPYLFQVDDKGGVVKGEECPLDPDQFVAIFTPKHSRAMGCTLAPPKLKWAVYGTADAPHTKLIPRDQWKPVSLEAYLPPVHDQDGRGQCNASGTCSAIETAREIAGLSYVELSAGDLYSQINGGTDRGSTLEDGIEAAVNGGCSTSKTVPYVWDGRRHDRDAQVIAERRMYRVTEAYLCPTADHVGSALQQGFPVVVGVMWHNNFTPDRSGRLPEVGRGGGGGHAFELYGMQPHPTTAGKWDFEMRNSWGPGWGMGGNALLPESHLGGPIGGFWAIRATVRTPEPFPPSETARQRTASMKPSELLLEGLTP